MRKISLLTLRSAGPIEFQHIYLRTYMVVRSRIARNREGGVRERKHKEVETYFHLRMCTLNSVTRTTSEPFILWTLKLKKHFFGIQFAYYFCLFFPFYFLCFNFLYF